MHRHLRIAPLALVAALVTGACGSDEPSGAAASVGRSDGGATTTVASPDQSSTTSGTEVSTDDTREEIVIGDMPTTIPAEPCALLSGDEVATVLSGADVGTATVTPAGAACEWNDASETTVLELTIYDLMGEDVSAITPELLAEMRPTDDGAALEPVDIGPVAIAGPDGDDAVVVWVSPAGFYQLRLWAVGAAPRPGTQWATLEGSMNALAEAIISRSGS